MVGRPRKNSIKAKQTVDTSIINKLEPEQATNNSKDIVEEDNESVNINQIEPKKIKNKIDSNTLASAYFSMSSKSWENSINTKVSNQNHF